MGIDDVAALFRQPGSELSKFALARFPAEEWTVYLIPSGDAWIVVAELIPEEFNYEDSRATLTEAIRLSDEWVSAIEMDEDAFMAAAREMEQA